LNSGDLEKLKNFSVVEGFAFFGLPSAMEAV